MDNFGDASIPGASADQQKVLEVVKNNDIDEGADIKSDFDHLGCKSPFSQKILIKPIYFYVIINVQWQKSNFEKFCIGYLMKDTSIQLSMMIILNLYK